MHRHGRLLSLLQTRRSPSQTLPAGRTRNRDRRRLCRTLLSTILALTHHTRPCVLVVRAISDQATMLRFQVAQPRLCRRFGRDEYGARTGMSLRRLWLIDLRVSPAAGRCVSPCVDAFLHVRRKGDSRRLTLAPAYRVRSECRGSSRNLRDGGPSTWKRLRSRPAAPL